MSSYRSLIDFDVAKIRTIPQTSNKNHGKVWFLCKIGLSVTTFVNSKLQKREINVIQMGNICLNIGMVVSRKSSISFALYIKKKKNCSSVKLFRGLFLLRWKIFSIFAMQNESGGLFSKIRFNAQSVQIVNCVSPEIPLYSGGTHFLI